MIIAQNMREIVQLARTNKPLRDSLVRFYVNQAYQIEASIRAYQAQEACAASGHHWDGGFEDGRDMGARCLNCGAHEE